MKACIRCGHWHTDAEKYEGRYLSCTEVKAYWAALKRRHFEQTGHVAMLQVDGERRIICVKCDQDLTDLL